MARGAYRIGPAPAAFRFHEGHERLRILLAFNGALTSDHLNRSHLGDQRRERRGRTRDPVRLLGGELREQPCHAAVIAPMRRIDRVVASRRSIARAPDKC
jgi:hypothetical protein